MDRNIPISKGMMLIDGAWYCQCGNGAILNLSIGWMCTEHGVTGKVA